MRNKQLGLVKDQVEQKQKKLSENFEKAVNFVGNERSQLMRLQEYETDYLNKIKQEQAQWTADNTGRYRHFCHQLSQAINEQKTKLATAEKQLEHMRSELCMQQQKINVLNDVINREAMATAHLQNKLLQKEMDEFSSRQHFYSSSSL